MYGKQMAANIIKISRKGDLSRQQQENNLKESVMKRSEDEDNIDIALSGTSATLVIQTTKRLYLAWVGDS